MRRILTVGFVTACAIAPAVMTAQSKPTAATYITDEEVKTVNGTPGIDRTIRVVDIGNENFAVGVIHRVGRGAAPAGAGGGAGRAGGGGGAGGGRAAGAGGGAGRANAAPPVPCGDKMDAVPAGGTPGMIAHDSQTEGYLIISGAGTLVTGGKIVNGAKSGPDNQVTTELNGPSCSGTAVGADIVKKPVKTGDIIIIPAGVPHGWIDIGDHVDYLSFRPSQRVLTAGYVNPAIRK
jgi:mannose-6-phosphate isomerase-like protein (cupin superfamily)